MRSSGLVQDKKHPSQYAQKDNVLKEPVHKTNHNHLTRHTRLLETYLRFADPSHYEGLDTKEDRGHAMFLHRADPELERPYPRQ